MNTTTRLEPSSRRESKYHHSYVDVARRQCYAAPVDRDGAIAEEAPVGEQVLVGKEDPLQPLRLDEGAPGGDVVDERVGGVDERDVGDVVERLGGVDAAVAAADDDDGRAWGGGVGHRNLSHACSSVVTA
jgi:hypothetical protein